MIAPLAKFTDWSVLQTGYAMLPQSVWREAANKRDLKLEQAVQFLNGPDFIPDQSQPSGAASDVSIATHEFVYRLAPPGKYTNFLPSG